MDMSWADFVNGVFELSGGFLILLSVFKLRRDKMVRGVDWRTTAFFCAWGYWNMYFYPSLDQWLSFGGGVFIVAMNSLWVGMMIHYIREERRVTKMTVQDVLGDSDE